MAVKSYDPSRAHSNEYTKLAAKTMKYWIQPSVDDPIQVYSKGPCPRCDDETDWTHPIRQVKQHEGGGEGVRYRGAGEGVEPDFAIDDVDLTELDEALRIVLRHGSAEYDVECSCTEDHPKRPPDKKQGCGASWVQASKW